MRPSRKRRKTKRLSWTLRLGIFALLVATIGGTVYVFSGKAIGEGFSLFNHAASGQSDQKTQSLTPEEILRQYMACINDQRYEGMYELLDPRSRENIAKDDFIARNQKIYEGIEAKNITISITDTAEWDGTQAAVHYTTRMDTLAGEITFSNEAIFTRAEDESFGLLWYPQLIFPGLDTDDKVKVNTLPSERGNIYDRSREMLAGPGVASSVGFVPGRMSEDREGDIAKVSELLEVPVETIQKKLAASYVRDDTFVPIKTIAYGQEKWENELLAVQGIKITNVPVRYYPLGEKAAHLTGYIQNVSAEDLEKLQGQGYNANSVIGKAGLEKIYEDKLRGIDGYEIIIVDSEGKIKQTLARRNARNGESITLTIDSYVQITLYDQLSGDKSSAVAMNPETGEVLALVSTPSYDANDFVLGLSASQWEALNEDENKPMYNRFKAALCPGSGFKAVIAAVGLSTGKISPEDNYGPSGRSWQKDASWGGYKVTTLKDYGNQAILKNALIYSDNIYFAKAALHIGADTLSQELWKIGFDEKIPFEYPLYSSVFSHTEAFENEIQLADSGYGQGQILVNPVHMASIYSAFLHDGNMVEPYLLYRGNPAPEIWKEQAFTKEAADILYDDLIAVADYAYQSLHLVQEVPVAGKTGTAEIKLSKDDREGTELGWFNVFTADKNAQKPLLIIAMVEDVKNRGGSGYVIPKIKAVFEAY